MVNKYNTIEQYFLLTIGIFFIYILQINLGRFFYPMPFLILPLVVTLAFFLEIENFGISMLGLGMLLSLFGLNFQWISFLLAIVTALAIKSFLPFRRLILWVIALLTALFINYLLLIIQHVGLSTFIVAIELLPTILVASLFYMLFSFLMPSIN